MAKCPYCKKEYAADMLQAQNGMYSVFTCPECDMILGIVKS